MALRFKALLLSAWIVFIVSTVPVYAGNPQLTFSEFLNKVRSYYPVLKKQQLRIEEAISAEHQAASGFLPRFKGVSEWSLGDDPVYVFGSRLKQGQFTQNDFEVSKLNSPSSLENLSFGIEGQWTLFDAFDTISKVRFAGHMTLSEKFNEEFAAMEISLISIEAFYRAVLEENLSRLAQEIFSRSQKDIAEAESLNKQGMVLGADFYTAKVSYGIIERMKNRFERDFQSSLTLMNILMGEEPLNAITLDYDLLPSPSTNKDSMEWLKTAYRSRQDLKAIDSAIDAAKAEVFRQEMSRLPKIIAFGRMEDNTRDWNDASGNYFAGIKGEMDFFDPSYGARTETVRLKLKEAAEDRKILKDKISKLLAQENSQYETVIADRPIAERMLEDARNAMEMTEKLYREGKKSVADLLEIRRVYLETVIKAYETRFYAQTCYSRLRYLSGTLDPTAAEKIGESVKKR